MSLFHTSTIACPACGVEAEHTIANSIAASRRPDLRAGIIAGTFQREACPACGTEFSINPVVTYMDVERACWILVRPCADRPLWDTFESGALDIFNDSFGTDAPRAAQSLGRSLRTRVTFGWSGLREKLLCEDYGINDVTLELTKLALLRTRLWTHKPVGATRRGMIHGSCLGGSCDDGPVLAERGADGAAAAAFAEQAARRAAGG